MPLHPDAGEEDEGWRRFMPDAVVRELRERQRRAEDIDRTMQLALARSEEALIRTHVENAIGFAALLDDHLPLDRAVQQYLGAVLLPGAGDRSSSSEPWHALPRSISTKGQGPSAKRQEGIRRNSSALLSLGPPWTVLGLALGTWSCASALDPLPSRDISFKVKRFLEPK